MSQADATRQNQHRAAPAGGEASEGEAPGGGVAHGAAAGGDVTSEDVSSEDVTRGDATSGDGAVADGTPGAPAAAPSTPGPSDDPPSAGPAAGRTPGATAGTREATARTREAARALIAAHTDAPGRPETPGRPEAGPEAGPESPAPDRLAARRPSPLWGLGLFRSELSLTFRRWRTLALLAVLAAVPVLAGVAVRIETRGGRRFDGGDDGQGPAFFSQITNNGIFLVFASLAATLPIFLPMTTSVVSGDAIAGESGSGTLRYLLVAPADRTRLLLAKFTATAAYCLVATVVVAVTALLVGALLFPLGNVTLISGTTVSFGDGLVRAAVVTGLVTLSLLGIASVGLFISTLAGSGIAAMAASAGLLVAIQIVDTIPQLHAVQPYLFPHYWLSFADVLRDPVYWGGVLKNLGLQALYVAVFGSAAWARFTTKDVTS